MSCIYCFFFFFFFLGLRCHIRIFFYGTYFENYGLGLGLALFRLGIQVGPAMKKILTCLGNSSEPSVKIWDLKLVSNFNSGIIWLG
jgi:hypothetical protein